MTMTMDAEVAPADAAAEEAPASEDSAEAMPMEPEQEAQAALALVALADALPGCASVMVEGLDGDGDVTLVCKDAKGAKSRYAVSADAIQNAIDNGIEPMASDAEVKS